MKHMHSLLCWRKCGQVGIYYHCWWDCADIKWFWHEVITHTNKIILQPLPFKLEVWVLNMWGDLAWTGLEKNLAAILLAAAKSVITSTWDLPSPPSVSAWYCKGWNQYVMSKITTVLNHTHSNTWYSKFKLTWAPVLKYMTKLEFSHLIWTIRHGFTYNLFIYSHPVWTLWCWWPKIELLLLLLFIVYVIKVEYILLGFVVISVIRILFIYHL